MSLVCSWNELGMSDVQVSSSPFCTRPFWRIPTQTPTPSRQKRQSLWEMSQDHVLALCRRMGLWLSFCPVFVQNLNSAWTRPEKTLPRQSLTHTNLLHGLWEDHCTRPPLLPEIWRSQVQPPPVILTKPEQPPPNKLIWWTFATLRFGCLKF